MERVVVLGAGIFGVTAALELRKRGHPVRLLDPGPLPHPLAASTDISKVVRLEYGADEPYTALAEDALEGWRRWNRDLGDPLFHETGVLFLRQGPLCPGTLEQDSFEVLSRRGHPIERLDAAAIRARFPVWNAERYPAAIHDREGGFVESGRVISRLVARARADGVELREGTGFGGLLRERGVPDHAPGRVAGVVSSGGERIEAETVVVATGAWTPHLFPWVASELRSTGQAVFHLVPPDPGPFLPERFPVFCADIQTTGYYGFPVHPMTGVLKIARHGPGRRLHPESPERVVTAAEIRDLRNFLSFTLPSLLDATLAFTRVCLYCDTWDGHFWIAHDPDRPGLVLATGDSGHAFKFAPVLGPLVADVVEGRSHPLHERFRWRPGLPRWRSEEATRFQEF